MKRLFLFFVVSLLSVAGINAQGPSNTYGLPYDAAKNQVIYQEVVQLPGTTKDKLYDRAMKAIKAMYKEAEKKIVINNKEGGEIQMKCSTMVLLKDKNIMTQSGYILYKFKISLKEGKYKYEFYDIHKDEGGVKLPLEKWLTMVTAREKPEERFAFFDNDIKKLIETLKANMSADKVEIKEDW